MGEVQARRELERASGMQLRLAVVPLEPEGDVSADDASQRVVWVGPERTFGGFERARECLARAQRVIDAEQREHDAPPGVRRGELRRPLYRLVEAMQSFVHTRCPLLDELAAPEIELERFGI